MIGVFTPFVQLFSARVWLHAQGGHQKPGDSCSRWGIKLCGQKIQRGGGDMRVKVQLVICADDERTETIHDVAVLEKDCHRLEQLGPTLAEAKQLLT
jgi:hypothetical protein